MERMLRKVQREPIGRILAFSSSMDDDEIQVNCGRCGKSMIVRLAEIYGKRLVDCVDCERGGQPSKALRLMRDQNAISVANQQR